MKKILKVLFICSFASMLLTACSGGSVDTTTKSSLETEQITTETTEETTKKVEVSPEDFVSAIKFVIEGDVGTGEKITDVVYNNGELTVYVNLENASIPDGFTIEDIALSRVSSITDSILALPNCDDLWYEIIIDFGEVGIVINTKSNIVDSIDGRYFDNFKIIK